MTKRPSETAYARLLTGWHRICRAGHNLNPTQYLILCDVLQTPHETISARQRAKRLRLTQPTIALALRSLAAHNLVTLVEVHPSGDPRCNHRSYPALSATPTKAAYHLLGLKGPYNRQETQAKA